MIEIGRNNEKLRNLWLRSTLLNIESGKSILDAGAGELKNSILCKHLKYVSQDFCQYDGKGDGQGLQMNSWNTRKIDIVSDICSIPVSDSSFDVVLCTEVLEHLPDPVRALNELTRILVKGGTLVLTAPFRSMTHFSPYHYCDGFSKYFYLHHLYELDYEIIEISNNGNWFDTFAEQLRLLPRVSRKYSFFPLSLIMYAYLMPIYWLLPVLRSMDRGSEELSTYGFFVVAKKK